MNELSVADLKRASASEKRVGDLVESTGGGAASLSRPDLIAAINQEIKDIEDENKRPGWSKWVLLAGVGTLIWLALGEFSPQTNVETIGTVFLFGSVFGECLAFSFNFFKQLNHPNERQQRYHLITDNPDSNLAILVHHSIRFAFLLLLSCSLQSGNDVPTLSTFFSVLLLMNGLVIVLRLSPKPVLHFDIHNSKYYIVAWGTMIWSGFLSFKLLLQLSVIDGGYKASDFKLGAVLVAVAYLLWLLVSEEKEKPSVLCLRKIRRGLAFGGLSVEQAAKDTDKVVFGLTAIDVLDRNLSDLSNSLRRITAANHKLIADCEGANSILDRLESGGNQWTSEARKVALIIDACATENAKNQEKVKIEFVNWKRLLRGFTKILRDRPDLTSQLTAKRQQTCQEVDLFVESLKARDNALSSVQSRYKEICVASWN
jgi:hypothetical protein